MKVLVCGGRDFENQELLERTLNDYPITSIVEGGARGADTLGRRYAERRGIPVNVFPPQWDKYGKAAGAIRNLRMLREGKPELVIAFPGRKGTANMIKIAREAGIDVVVVDI